jgi:putative chitinase
MSRETALLELSRAEASLAAVRAALADDTAPPVAPPTATPSGAGLGLSSPTAFYDALRVAKVLGVSLEQTEVDGCEAILRACTGWPLSWAAYALATADIETNGTMQPVREAYWLSASAQAAWATKMYDIQGARPDKARELGNLSPGDGIKYAGRGYPQVTGKANYQKLQDALGIPLVTNPDLALAPDHAAAIMRFGMETGLFTGKSLNDYLPAVATRENFKNARRVINGQDRAEQIADIAVEFQSALQKGGWR